jgi:hypothetical protein
MPSGFFLKKKPPCTQLNTARVLEKCSSLHHSRISLSADMLMFLAVENVAF